MKDYVNHKPKKKRSFNDQARERVEEVGAILLLALGFAFIIYFF